MRIKRPISRQPLPKHAKRVFKGILFGVYQWRQKMFDGTFRTFEKLKRADSVMVLPVTKDRRIILAEQKQPGKKPFISLVGGVVGENEDILEAAKRELLEETGYGSDEFILFYSTQPMSKIEWAVYTFIAKNCKKVASPNLDSGEKIRLRFVNFDEFTHLVSEGLFKELEITLKILKAKRFLRETEKLKKLFLD